MVLGVSFTHAGLGTSVTPTTKSELLNFDLVIDILDADVVVENVYLTVNNKDLDTNINPIYTGLATLPIPISTSNSITNVNTAASGNPNVGIHVSELRIKPGWIAYLIVNDWKLNKHYLNWKDLNKPVKITNDLYYYQS